MNANDFRKLPKPLKVIIAIAVIALAIFAVIGYIKYGPEFFAEEEISAPVTQNHQTSSSPSGTQAQPSSQNIPAESAKDVTGRDELALYIHTYGHLPSNFITKEDAKKLGWEGGGLDPYKNGACIGGDVFRNSEKLLPEKSGRVWHECDVDTLHAKERGAKRIVYSSDGLIFYTSDHYESYTQLY